MKKLKYLPCILVIILLCSCASAPPRQPSSNQSSIIGISIEIDKLLLNSHPKSIYLVKIDDEGHYISNNDLLSSNYQNHDQLYFLDPQPGRYIIVAAFEKESDYDTKRKRTNTKYTTYYFPLGLIKYTDVQVKENNVIYLGHYLLDPTFTFSYTLKNPDDAQLHYCRRLQPNKVNPTVGGCLNDFALGAFFGVAESARVVTLEKRTYSKQSEIEFWGNAIEDFKGGFFQKIYYRDKVQANRAWVDMMKKRLEELKE